MHRLLACFLPLALTAAELHVAIDHPDAADDAPATVEAPLRSLQVAVDRAQPGDRIVVHPGVYREAIRIGLEASAERPLTIEAMEPGTVVVSGAEVVTDWRREAGSPPVYSTEWSRDFSVNSKMVDGVRTLTRAHGAPAPTGCAELVIDRGQPLQMVMDRGEVEPGCFHVDWDADRLYVHLADGADPGEVMVEVGHRQMLLGPVQLPSRKHDKQADGTHVHLRGLHFRHAANFAQRGGVEVGPGWMLEDVVVSGNSAGGIKCSGPDIVLRRVVARANGWSGIGGFEADGLLMEDCVSEGTATAPWATAGPGCGSTGTTPTSGSRTATWGATSATSPPGRARGSSSRPARGRR